MFLSCLLHTNKLCSSKMHHNVVNVIQTIVLFSSSHHHTGVPWRPRPSSPSTSPRPQWSSPARGSHDIRKSLSPSAWVRVSPGRSQQWFRQKISEKNWANIFESDLKWFIFSLLKRHKNILPDKRMKKVLRSKCSYPINICRLSNDRIIQKDLCGLCHQQ